MTVVDAIYCNMQLFLMKYGYADTVLFLSAQAVEERGVGGVFGEVAWEKGQRTYVLFL